MQKNTDKYSFFHTVAPTSPPVTANFQVYNE